MDVRATLRLDSSRLTPCSPLLAPCVHVHSYEFVDCRQDGACPLDLDEAAGLVYLGAGDRVLYALDLSSGRLRWSWRSSQAFESVVAGGGRVLVSTEDYRQVALDGASGQLAWQLQFRRLSSPQTGVFGDVLVRPDQDG